MTKNFFNLASLAFEKIIDTFNDFFRNVNAGKISQQQCIAMMTLIRPYYYQLQQIWDALEQSVAMTQTTQIVAPTRNHYLPQQQIQYQSKEFNVNSTIPHQYQQKIQENQNYNNNTMMMDIEDKMRRL
jgi:hypothetical protein